MALSLEDKEILEQLKNNLVQALDDHVKIIKAFGSRVRGDAHEWSDLDVMIVVSQINPEIKEVISQIRYNVMWEYHFRPLISLLLYGEEEFKEASRSLMGNIEEEGVTIWKSA